MKRRDFLSGTALGGITAFASAGRMKGQRERFESPVRHARHVIFYAYDGFTWEDLATASHYSHRQKGRALALERLLSRGNCGSMMTHSLTSVVTDSSAASTAWGTGRRTVNGYVGMYPDGRELKTILELARDQGRKTGLITTTRVTHATPAGFSTHVRDRDFEDAIAEQYLELQPDVILGGGARHFDPALRKDGRDLYAQFAAQGYSVIRQAEQLEGNGGSKLLGTFTSSHLPFEIDRVQQGVPAPSLAEMTRKGLELLSASSQGFVVQVEAGRIDHANHNNDPSAMVWDVLAADEALEVILEYADRTPETLVILASDHGTGGGAVYGVGNDYLKASEAFDRIAARKASFDFVLGKLGASPTRAESIDAVGDFLNLTISPEQADLLVDAIQGKPSMPRQGAFHEQPVNSLGWIAAAGENFSEPEHLNIHYSAGQHTAGPVPIALYGAGTAEARLGLVDITDVFGWMTQAMRVEWANPVMNEAEALSILRGMSETGA